MGRRVWPAILIAVALGALACLPAAAAGANTRDWRDGWSAARSRAYDPLEPLNRGLYAVNQGLERLIVRPVLFVVLRLTPGPLQRGLHHVLVNLGEPVTAVNDLLQLRVGRAATAAARFVTNSTLGVLGLLDVASDHGLAYHKSDFGQTLGRYGAPPGPYVFIPVLGPTTLRDFGGRFADGALDPIGRVRFTSDTNIGTGRLVLSTVDTQATGAPVRMAIERRGGDAYAAVRTAYLDARETAIHGPRTELAAVPPPRQPTALAGAGETQPDAFAAVSGTFFRPLD